jgi:hypothetical protein
MFAAEKYSPLLRYGAITVFVVYFFVHLLLTLSLFSLELISFRFLKFGFRSAFDFTYAFSNFERCQVLVNWFTFILLVVCIILMTLKEDVDFIDLISLCLFGFFGIICIVQFFRTYNLHIFSIEITSHELESYKKTNSSHLRNDDLIKQYISQNNKTIRENAKLLLFVQSIILIIFMIYFIVMYFII